MKTDTLTGPNLSYHVAVLEKYTKVEIVMFYGKPVVTCQKENAAFDDEDVYFDYADPATFQPIAEREKISVRWHSNDEIWSASTSNKLLISRNERYRASVGATGSTMAEAMMRCYVKSYLGEDTKGE